MNRLKSVCLVLLLAMPLLAGAQQAQTLDIEVKGMSCPFCVYGVEKRLKQLPEVDSVSVDLRHSRARLTLVPERKPDLDRIRKAILDAGFTPGRVRPVSE